MATASRDSFGDALREAREKVQRCPTTRARLKRTVTRATELHADAIEAPPEVPSWGIGGLLVALLVGLALLLVACAGCVPVEAIKQAEVEAAIGHGVASNPGLPIEARQYGAREFRAWSAQHRALSGQDVPGADAWPLLPVDVLPPAPAVEAPR